MLKCNLFLRDVFILPDVDEKYSQNIQMVLKECVYIPQPPLLHPTILLGAAIPIAPVTAAMLELNVTLNKTTHQTMHIALLQTCLK
jgi:hypothetical protein